VRQFARLASALLCCTGRVTMRGIARWGGPGASYRTVQRFFSTKLPWPQIHWHFFQAQHLRPDEEYILAGDEVVVTKAGKHTHGLDRFYSGLLQKVVPGLAFFNLALVATTERRAYPLCCQQVLRSEAEKAAGRAKRAAKRANQTTAAAERRPVGRPKGRRNKPKSGEYSPELLRIQAMLKALVARFAGVLKVRYVALDGHFGNAAALAMVRECDLHIVSKLRHDAALYLAYDGPYAGRGPHRKYGAKLDYRALPACMLRQRVVEEGIESSIYSGPVLHKEFAQPLNVVISVKTKLESGTRAHVVLFSSDPELDWERLVDYYSLRFQIEFTFREAKQDWGLEDFMNIKAQPVENAANLAMFMVSLSGALLRQEQQPQAARSVQDLKAAYRGRKYVEQTIKMLAEKPADDLMERIVQRVTGLGRIHPRKSLPDAA